MIATSINLNSAVRSIPDNKPFSLLGGLSGEIGAMVGVIRIHNNRPAGSWERHPKGDELLVVLDGCFTMTVRGNDGTLEDHCLSAGDALLIPHGHSHSAQLHTPHIDILFVTPREGNEEWTELHA
ncbi:cupin domain-containing protein [Pusillimonas caeni]|uniref:cupin domain-containing protein n=1 Tax=Pusillimonas caeni TaxID=1348472 RepID=UPI000E59CF08|nr:cupin domain-containing protein [Pusillimonas caeni]TFL14759.1 cupin domain-containing protein [Pusillimonas caeni]